MMRVSRLAEIRSVVHARWRQITYEYAEYLEKNPAGVIRHEALLPHPKGELWKALMFCIANSKTRQELNIYTGLIHTLTAFQDIGDLDVIEPPPVGDLKSASDQEVIEYARTMKPYIDLRNKYSHTVSIDAEFARTSASEAVAANEYMWPYYKKLCVRLASLGSGRKVPAECIDFPS